MIHRLKLTVGNSKTVLDRLLRREQELVGHRRLVMDNSSRIKLSRWNSLSGIAQRGMSPNHQGVQVSKTRLSIPHLSLQQPIILHQIMLKFSLAALQSLLNRHQKQTLMTFFARSLRSFRRNSKVYPLVKTLQSPTSNSCRRSATSEAVFRIKTVIAMLGPLVVQQEWEGEAIVWQLWCHHLLKSNRYKEVMVVAQELDTSNIKLHYMITSFSQTLR